MSQGELVATGSHDVTRKGSPLKHSESVALLTASRAERECFFKKKKKLNIFIL